MFSAREMVEMYACAAVVVIPLNTSSGVNDAMGCSTLYEAMAMGKAIVASRTHHMESYIMDDENGILVPQGEVGPMRESIKLLLDSADLRKQLGGRARSIAELELTTDQMSHHLTTFFSSLIEG